MMVIILEVTVWDILVGNYERGSRLSEFSPDMIFIYLRDPTDRQDRL